MGEEERQLIDWLNVNLLKEYKFKIELTAEGGYYTDLRKDTAKRLNGKPFKTIEEILKFIGGSIKRLYLRETELYKKTKM